MWGLGRMWVGQSCGVVSLCVTSVLQVTYNVCVQLSHGCRKGHKTISLLCDDS